jgi:hypothetical protein
MGKEDMNLLMDRIMKGNGVRIKSMEKEFYTSKLANHNMTDNGEMIFLMGGELYTLNQEFGRSMKDSLEVV